MSVSEYINKEWVSVNITCSYRKDLDEMRLFNTDTGENAVYIQGYSRKYPIPKSERVSIELLVLMSVSYPEIKKAI